MIWSNNFLKIAYHPFCALELDLLFSILREKYHFQDNISKPICHFQDRISRLIYHEWLNAIF